jgi:hypothetical protein
MIRVLRTWHQQFSHLATTIPNTKALMHFIDTLEEFRDLSLAEWNFMHLLKQHLESLLHYQNIYWKQRETIKWVKLGDECNTFFNANATIKLRRNTISSSKDSQGNIHTSHEAKVQLSWASYKERIGISEYTTMHFDLSDTDKLDPESKLVGISFHSGRNKYWHS